jgi:hypothetical protein
VQKTREEYSLDLSDIPDKEHADAEQYTNTEQNINYCEELESAYMMAGLGDHDSLLAEEYNQQELSLEPEDATDEVDDEYDNNGFFD